MSGKRAFVRGTSADGRMNERTHTLDCAARGLEAPSPALEVEDTAAQIYDLQRSLLGHSELELAQFIVQWLTINRLRQNSK